MTPINGSITPVVAVVLLPLNVRVQRDTPLLVTLRGKRGRRKRIELQSGSVGGVYGTFLVVGRGSDLLMITTPSGKSSRSSRGRRGGGGGRYCYGR